MKIDDIPLKDSYSFVKIFNDIQSKRFTEMLRDDNPQVSAFINKLEVDRLRMELEMVKEDLAKEKKQKPSFGSPPAVSTNKTSSVGNSNTTTTTTDSSHELDKLFDKWSKVPITGQEYEISIGYTLVSLPLWLGEVRQCGFHDLITSIVKGKDTAAIEMVHQSLSDFSKYRGKDIAISFIGNGPDTDVKTTLPAVFHSIILLNGDDGEYSNWTTPVRLKIFLENEKLHFKDRLLYGGHFYATGSAEMDEKVGGIPKTTSSLISLEILHIFWEDYRNKHKPAAEIL